MQCKGTRGIPLCDDFVPQVLNALLSGQAGRPYIDVCQQHPGMRNEAVYMYCNNTIWACAHMPCTIFTLYLLPPQLLCLKVCPDMSEHQLLQSYRIYTSHLQFMLFCMLSTLMDLRPLPLMSADGPPGELSHRCQASNVHKTHNTAVHQPMLWADTEESLCWSQHCCLRLDST